MNRLRGRDVEVVVDTANGAPVIRYWGPLLGERADVDALAAASERPVVTGSADEVAPVAVVPEHAAGFTGRPGLAGHRPSGTAWAPRFVTVDVASNGETLEVTTRDVVAELTLRYRFEIADALVVTAELTNDSAQRMYLLHELSVTLPVPEQADEVGTFSGRWAREFHQLRRPWSTGAVLVENRRGRTSHEYPPLVFAGTQGYGEWEGSVWGAHLAWSGNHRLVAERLPDGRRYLQLGELLHPGEIVLAPGESYRTPEVVAVHSSNGLTAATQQFHRHLRARSTHPATARPVLVNTWEAVYFDHDLGKLTELADRAARVGVERFVLDDGWFGSRRDDTQGLGDWVVSPDVHPAGLGPLIDHVNDLGMEFGLWFEPEMVNPDSDLFRAHPEWALVTEGYEPVLSRQQLVLDLARPDAFDHVLGQIDAILTEFDISYVKWDLNRDHIAGSGADGAAGTHAQTLAAYRLMDQLREKHPGVEIETCSGGGGRIDHEILRRTQRVWTSDCNDALERQTIQRGLSMLIPPELMGAHIGPERAHTTGRRQDLPFRAITAMFGHLGIEWNLLRLDDEQLDRLADAVALHKRFRPLLHSGDVVRFDTVDSVTAHGVFAADRSEGLISFAQLVTAESQTPAPLHVPGLDPDARYEIRNVPLPGAWPGPNRRLPGWWEDELLLDGRTLEVLGLQLPSLHAETAVLLHLTAIS